MLGTVLSGLGVLVNPHKDSVQEILLVVPLTDVQLTLRWKLRNLPRSHSGPVMEPGFERRLPDPKSVNLASKFNMRLECSECRLQEVSLMREVGSRFEKGKEHSTEVLEKGSDTVGFLGSILRSDCRE